LALIKTLRLMSNQSFHKRWNQSIKATKQTYSSKRLFTTLACKRQNCHQWAYLAEPRTIRSLWLYHIMHMVRNFSGWVMFKPDSKVWACKTYTASVESYASPIFRTQSIALTHSRTSHNCRYCQTSPSFFAGNVWDARSQSSLKTSKLLKSLFQLFDVSEWIAKNWWHLFIQILKLAEKLCS
jgi:hypothetical protein